MAPISQSLQHFRNFIAIVFLLPTMQLLMATQYNVGDDAGWGVAGVDYGAWAARHQFQVGDSLYFAYPQGAHSVLQVTQQDFQNCITTNPISSDNGVGNKLVYLSYPGTFFFVCGVPGHCTAERLGITVYGQGGGNNPYSNIPGLIYNQGVPQKSATETVFKCALKAAVAGFMAGRMFV